MIKQITLVLLILFSFSFAEDVCNKKTGIITTSFHVYNALFENELIGNVNGLLKMYQFRS